MKNRQKKDMLIGSPFEELKAGDFDNKSLRVVYFSDTVKQTGVEMTTERRLVREKRSRHLMMKGMMMLWMLVGGGAPFIQ